ncbi:Ca2+-binding protein, RTX toxin [Xenococcus sp. PCC 7305]|uniref:S8 family serine peptidase n=1 Tax=Xenococcus sp. PCC 7305 TaxID=102125 RepID=UPI0002AC54C6|nr:S8 family serine peptidase [Xenococcus sp. PCC 7305]ELS04865.1 Ca2+-binding protein, RTX toxin [Xenococcus sp. PCC 7305]
MDLNGLPGSKSSAVSDVLLQLENLNNDRNSKSNDNISSNLFKVSNDFLIIDENIRRVAVRITVEDIDALLPFLDNLGFETLGSSAQNHLIEGYIAFDNISNLEVLVDEGLIMGVIPVYKPVTNVGDTDSQADFVQEANRVRAALPTSYDGTGQTIAVFSDSYDTSGDGSAAADITSGDLPAGGVTVLQELDEPGSDEGRAMLQLVHDLAPGADLVFSSVFFGEADFAQQIRDAADSTIGNSSVLVDDIGYLSEPFFQDGLIAQAIDDVVTNEDVTYFSAAGNSADESYEATSINFVNTGVGTGQFSDIKYDFDPGAGIDTNQQITLAPGASFRISFQWDDPFFTTSGVDTDLDIFIYDSANNLVDQSASNNIANQTPFEIVVVENTSASNQDFFIEIEKFAGPDPNRIKWISFDNDPLFVEYDTNSPTINGHPAATNAQAVAAIPFFDQNNPEPFTSEGPNTILFEPNGTLKAVPEIRQTPDIAAIDDTNTTFFIPGNDIPEDLDTFPNFSGTSAAAPHAAAVAALVQQANPSFTPHQVYARLQSTAIDITPSGFDNVTGFGLINAYDAIFGSVVPATLPFSENFDDGDLPLAFETNSNTSGRIQVTSDFSPLGAQQLILDSSAEGFGLSLNEAILHLDTTGFTDILLSFQQKEFSDEDDVMPSTFLGSNNSDGVALSVDGTNWVRLISLTGSNSLSSFQTNSFDLTAIAAANSLTLGSDVQIKFQQFDNFPLTNDGFAFDNISVTGTSISICNPTNGDDNLTSCVTSGDDNINGLGGNDTLAGGDGNDTLNGSTGNDVIFGQNDNDRLLGGDDNDTLYGDSGNDVMFGQNDNDRLLGGDGNDTLYGDAGADILIGQNDNDRLLGGDDNDTLYGGSGLDKLQGGDGNDTLYGESDADVMFGQNDNDRLLGGDGNDTLYGDAGADILIGQNDNDRLLGGDDGDFLYGGIGDDTLIGQSGADDLFGEENNDFLYGGDGNDTLDGGAQDDVLFGDDNDDRLLGKDGNDTLNGGSGLDTLQGGNGNDNLNGNAGADVLFGQNNDDRLLGGDDNDTLYGDAGADLLFGQNNDDRLLGGNGNDTLYGDAGADILIGQNNNDRLLGGNDNDALYGGSGLDTLQGGNGNDTLYGESDADVLFGQNNDDRLLGGDGNDTLYGDSGADVLIGQNNNDRLLGGNGNDTLFGESGADVLVGQNNNDSLLGGDGADTLIGGLGLDRLVGGPDSDRFTLESNITADRVIIEDFADGTDLLDLTGGLAFGDLTISQVGADTSILETATTQTLAVLEGINAGDIDMTDFI